MHYYYWDGGWNGLDFFMSTLMALLWILLIVWIVRTVVRSRHWQGTPPADPLDIAKSRYARGEITKAELADIKKELHK